MSNESTNTNLSIFNQSKDVMPVYSESDSKLGNESMSLTDIALPQLKILQPLSPEMETMPNAKTGLLCNTVSNEVFDKVYVMNLDFKKQFSVFKQRAKGGGFHGAFETKEAADDHVKTLDGNIADYQVVETGVHSLLLLDDQGQPKMPALMYFKSTSLSASRNWNSMIVTEGKGGPRFVTVWQIGSRKNTNDKGTWWTPDITFAGFASQELYDSAKAQYDALKGSAVPQDV